MVLQKLRFDHWSNSHLQNPGRDFSQMLEVFPPPPDDVPSSRQQFSTSTVNGVGGALLPELAGPTRLHSNPPASLTSGIHQQLQGLPPTGVRDLRTTALNSCVSKGGGEDGPPGPSVSSLPRDLVEALLEVGIKELPDGGFHQMFLTAPVSPARGSTRSPPGERSW